MKTIKKSHWAYKLIDFTFDQESKTTCGFYWETFVSLIVFPITSYLHLLCEAFSNEDEPNLDIPKFKDKWESLFAEFFIAALFYVFSMLITLLFWALYSMFTNTNNTSGYMPWGIIFIGGAIGMIVYPFIFYWSVRIQTHLKEKYCQPITFVD